MSVNHTFPQNGDDDYAENFGQLIGHDNASQYVESGMSFSVDYTTPDVTINSGLAYVKYDTETIGAISEDRFDVGYAVQVDQQTLSLTDNDVNYVYVRPSVGTDDSASYVVLTDQSNANSDDLLIGEIDTSADSSTTHNRSPDASYHNVTITGILDVSENVTLSSDLTLGNDIIATDGEIVFDESNGYVPLSILEHDSVTISAGDGLKTGGSVQLGSSVTIDIEPSDFAGTFLSDDGSDNLAVNVGSGIKGDGSDNITVEPSDFAGTFLSDDGSDNLTVDIGRGLENDGSGNIRFDEDVSFTFTSQISASGGLDVQSISSPSGISVDIDSNNSSTTTSFDVTQDGGSSTIFTASEGGAVTVPNGPFSSEGAQLKHNWHSKQEGGTVGDGNFVPVGTFGIEDGETLYVTQAMLTENGFDVPADSELDLIIASDQDSVESDTTTVLQGDGSTLYDDQTGEPLASRTNNSGSHRTYVIGLDNGNYNSGVGDAVTGYGGFIARIV